MRSARYGGCARSLCSRIPRVVTLAVLSAIATPLAPRLGSVAAQAAQLGTVSGTVRSAESREPLPAVTLTVSGTQLGAITGADGRFTIANVPTGL